MNHKLIIGRGTQGATDGIVHAIRTLPSNEVVKLDETMLENILKLLPASLQEVDSLFDLRLTLQKKESMAHSGWLYSRYLEACRKANVDTKRVVALYKNGFFCEFRQFDAREQELLFIGFGQNGEEMLEIVLQAESQFNPDDFDSDGYPN